MLLFLCRVQLKGSAKLKIVSLRSVKRTLEFPCSSEPPQIGGVPGSFDGSALTKFCCHGVCCSAVVQTNRTGDLEITKSKQLLEASRSFQEALLVAGAMLLPNYGVRPL